jgi:CheY-like chemotaxis protein
MSVPPRGNSQTILLVEDEDSVLKLGKRLLESLGYQVVTAPGPEEAIQIVTGYAGDINLMITDVVMPGMNGRDLANTIRAIRPGLRCLYMSGYTADVIASRGVLEEGVPFIQKPFSLDALASKVHELLGTI